MIIDKELYNTASEITSTDYEEIIYVPGQRYGYISEYACQSIISDLIHEIDVLKEKIEDLERDIDDNYKPIKREEQYEVNYRDFI